MTYPFSNKGLNNLHYRSIILVPKEELIIPTILTKISTKIKEDETNAKCQQKLAIIHVTLHCKVQIPR